MTSLPSITGYNDKTICYVRNIYQLYSIKLKLLTFENEKYENQKKCQWQDKLSKKARRTTISTLNCSGYIDVIIIYFGIGP